MKLSENFKLSEFEVSATGNRLGIDNKIPAEFVPKVRLLVDHVLQPLREHFGPIVVISGYRSPYLNTKVGGAPTSQHTKGEAADIRVPGHSHKEVCQYIIDNLDFDQLIYEFGESGWIHVSYRGAKNRKDVLSAKKTTSPTSGKRVTKYVKGLK